jgi:hypothetical protein
MSCVDPTGQEAPVVGYVISGLKSSCLDTLTAVSEVGESGMGEQSAEAMTRTRDPS